MAFLPQTLSDFLERKSVKPSFKIYFVDAMSYMALGLFASLLIGSILNTLGKQFELVFLTDVVWPLAKSMMGPAIAVAVAYALKAPPLVLFSATICGAAGAVSGGPVGAFIAAIVATELGKLIANETKVDILITPCVTILSGVLVAQSLGPLINEAMISLGDFIDYATQLQPFLMGVLLAVIMGICLTLPISSAAIAIMLSMDGLAAGAATVGCATQMVGFAVMSFRENGWGGVVAQGLGTPMLQLPNIMKKPVIWLPPIIASAILGPIAIVVFEMKNTPLGAGMGTSGFVGQLETMTAMLPEAQSATTLLLNIGLLHVLLPAVLCWLLSEAMRKAGVIKPGDLTITLS